MCDGNYWRKKWAQIAALLLVAGLLAATGCKDDDDNNGNNGTADAVDSTDGMTDADDDADTTQPQGIRIPGLSAQVKVQYDEAGVVHFDCQTDMDCYAAQGYFHAQNRFFEMDLIRRQTLGELHEVVVAPSAVIDTDVTFRRMMTTPQGEEIEDLYYDEANDETKAILDAYAQGVNTWLGDMRAERNGATLTAEYEHPFVRSDNIRDWEPEDTIALYLQLAYQLSETSDDDLFRGEMAAALDPAVASDLFTTKPGIESNTLQASGVDPNVMMLGYDNPGELEQMRVAHERLFPARRAMREAREQIRNNPSWIFGGQTGEDGSNNWAVSGDKTESGQPLLADDPHLSLNNPAIWHYVELDSKTNGEGNLHVAGASIPAVPGIVVGHNEDVAWGVTTARLDLADAYIEELNADGTAVIYNGQEVDIITKEFTFADETRTFEYVPHHGPIISKDVENQRAVSVRWVAQEPGADLNFITGMLTATNVDEFMDNLENLRTINQNWVVMDRDGSIGWYPHGAVPKRPWASEHPNWLPLPGDGSAEWDGTLASSELPKMKDPPAGFIATANNDMDGSYSDGDATNDGHTPWQSPPAWGHRHKRIVDLLEASDTHTTDSMHDIQADVYSLHGEVLVPHVIDIAQANSGELSADAQNVVDALDAWQYECPTGMDGTDPDTATPVSDETEATESIGCAAFHVMMTQMTDAVFSDELNGIEDVGGYTDWYKLQSALIYVFDDPSQLNNGADYFDDVTTDETVETEADTVIAALEETANQMEILFGSTTPDDWRWGKIHQVELASFFAAAGLTEFNEGPFINDGGFFTVDVANPTGRGGEFAGNYNHPNGASLRIVFETTDTAIQGYFQLPGGQDHHRDSQFYLSLMDEWLSNTSTPLLFDRDEVEANAVETIEVQPAE
ncbi:MAG: penicillin acylase family protein [Myxococcota bacterium]